MATGSSDSSRSSVLSEALVNDQPQQPDSFVKQELKQVWRVGWPIYVSALCRIGMLSMDSFFIGHLPDLPNTPGQPEAIADIGAFPALPEGAGMFTTVGRRLWDPTYDKETYMSASSLADMCTTVLFVPMFAFSLALNPLVGQAMGSSNKTMAGVWLQLAFLTQALVFLPLLVVWLFVGPILALLGFDPNVCKLAGEFAAASIVWPLPNALYMSFRCYFQAQGISRPAMWNGVIFVGVNFFLNWLFVFGGPLKWIGWGGLGFVGAAISLDTSRTLQPITYHLYMVTWKKLHRPTWPGWTKQSVECKNIKAYLEQAVPQVGSLLLRITQLQGTTLLVAKLGKEAVAASSSALWGYAPFVWPISSTISMLTAMRVGYHLGAGDAAKAKRAAKLFIGLSVGICGALALIISPLAPLVMRAMTDEKNVRRVGAGILPARMLQNVFDSSVFTLTGGVFAAQGRTRIATYMSLFIDMPLSLGSAMIMILLYTKGKTKEEIEADVSIVYWVYWVQAASSLVQLLIALLLLRGNDWELYARQARERQNARAAATAARQATLTELEEAVEQEAKSGKAAGKIASPEIKEEPTSTRGEPESEPSATA